ncbi:MAG: hypothetical protein Q8P41_17820 [Pseudomonadota bacterium]|nr:hypothetical protein [Pseudomonadota bacterium]
MPALDAEPADEALARKLGCVVQVVELGWPALVRVLDPRLVREAQVALVQATVPTLEEGLVSTLVDANRIRKAPLSAPKTLLELPGFGASTVRQVLEGFALADLRDARDALRAEVDALRRRGQRLVATAEASTRTDPRPGLQRR